MNEIITQNALIRLPESKVEISIRPGTMDDLPFIDAMQKKTLKMVGFMQRGQIEGKIRLGHVLVAEEVDSCQLMVDSALGDSAPQSAPSTINHQLSTRLGYCIGNDRYFNRDDVGIIYALNVVPGAQRKLVGAALIKAMFERSAWGCRLFSCWCAQDIAANYFWESIGFVPIAFRTGSKDKGPDGGPRVHIFWQKRIRERDTTTPYWFPCETKGGAIREDRIVLPIPPGTHWKDAKPVLLPGAEVEVRDQKSQIREEKKITEKKPRARLTSDLRPLTSPPKTPANIGGGLHFAPVKPVKETKAKAKREPKPKVKNDPQFVAKARELRDRWMEAVQSGQLVIESAGKYDTSRMIEGGGAVQIMLALPSAA